MPKRTRAEASGVIHIDKPAGVTSRAVLNQLQSRLGIRRLGHAGTLDPIATGVLVVCLGPATRLVEYIQQLPKTYDAQFRLGMVSDTLDCEGQVETLCHPPIPTFDQLQDAAQSLTGRILQTPPAFSAVRVGGERAHRRARAGQPVVLEPRPVVVETIELIHYAYPDLHMRIVCHSGTYVRALGRDLAEAVGTGAVMTGLRRRAIGPFQVETAQKPDAPRAELMAAVQPPRAALPHLPVLPVSDEAAQRLRNGGALPRQVLPEPTPAAWNAADTPVDLAAAVDRQGELVAVVARTHNTWQPRKVLPPRKR